LNPLAGTIPAFFPKPMVEINNEKAEIFSN
jgi:hypothetical protein